MLVTGIVTQDVSGFPFTAKKGKIAASFQRLG
jgi:hypothetical protein